MSHLRPSLQAIKRSSFHPQSSHSAHQIYWQHKITVHSQCCTMYICISGAFPNLHAPSSCPHQRPQMAINMAKMILCECIWVSVIRGGILWDDGTEGQNHCRTSVHTVLHIHSTDCMNFFTTHTVHPDNNIAHTTAAHTAAQNCTHGFTTYCLHNAHCTVHTTHT